MAYGQTLSYPRPYYIVGYRCLTVLQKFEIALFSLRLIARLQMKKQTSNSNFVVFYCKCLTLSISQKTEEVDGL